MIGGSNSHNGGVGFFLFVVAVALALFVGLVFGFVSASVQFRQTYNHTWVEPDKVGDFVGEVDNISGFEYPEYKPRNNNRDVVFVNVFNDSLCPVYPTPIEEDRAVCDCSEGINQMVYDLGRLKPKDCSVPACSFGFSQCVKQVNKIVQGIRQTDK